MDDPDDLVVLAADNQMQEALRGILSRPRALAIAPISFEVFSHPNKDPGCQKKAHEFLRNLRADYRYGLVLFDYDGCGASHTSSPGEIASDVEERLQQSGWGDQARCVVIDPELEVWAWSDVKTTPSNASGRSYRADFRRRGGNEPRETIPTAPRSAAATPQSRAKQIGK